MTVAVNGPKGPGFTESGSVGLDAADRCSAVEFLNDLQREVERAQCMKDTGAVYRGGCEYCFDYFLLALGLGLDTCDESAREVLHNMFFIEFVVQRRWSNATDFLTELEARIALHTAEVAEGERGSGSATASSRVNRLQSA